MADPLPPSKAVLDDSKLLSGPFWGELRVFLAVAKARSFNRAAEALNMSQPTVSRQVRRLQDVMGAQLVVPTQAGITLTRQGEELARSLRDLDQKLFEISADLNAEARTAEGTVRLAGSEALAGLFIAPALVAFGEVYPKIKLQICTPQDRKDFRANKSDVLISLVPSTRSDVISRQVGYLHMLPIASHAYIERYGVPTRSNLSSHNFLQCDVYTQTGYEWNAWLDLVARGVLTHSCDNLITYSMMVRSGVGIGLVSTAALADPVVVPLELGVHLRSPIYVMTPAERLGTMAVRIVVDWLAEIFGESVPWFSKELKLEQLPREIMTPVVSRLLACPEQTP